MAQRKSTPVLAGVMCLFKDNSHMCTQYARYAISADPDKETPKGYCGNHMTIAVRAVWKSGHAAVVQEIPGMWR